MAGETPGADRVNRRRQLAWNDRRSTDKYYASGDKSALGDQSAARPGAKTPPAPRLRADDRSADKYYRAQNQAPTAQQRARGERGSGTLQLRGKPSQRGAFLFITAPEDVTPTMQEAVALLHEGVAEVVVTVKHGQKALLRRARAALDLLVTRQALTEDQARDVRFVYEPPTGADEPLGAPAPRGEQRVADDETADPYEFLHREHDASDDAPVSTAPVTPVVVDTSNDPPAQPATDDDEDTFLAPAEAPPEQVPEGKDAQVGAREDEPPFAGDDSAIQPGEALPAKKVKPGRRSGRGT